MYDFLLVINTKLASYLAPFPKLWLIIGLIIASESRAPHIDALAGVIFCQYRHK